MTTRNDQTGAAADGRPWISDGLLLLATILGKPHQLPPNDPPIHHRLNPRRERYSWPAPPGPPTTDPAHQQASL